MAISLASGATLRHLSDLFNSGTAVGVSDGQLLARYAASNDGPAFAALVARHGPMVLATCRAILRHEHDVEDTFQATFLVLAKKASSVRGGDAIGGWLHRVAYRVAVQTNIELQKRRRREAEVSAMEVPDTTRPGLDVDLHSILHEEIDRLPDRHRLAVVLCDLEGLSYDQAAARLDWTVPALRCRLARARQRLRDRLSRRGVTGAALGVVLVASDARAAVPAAWAESAVAAATGGASSMAAVAISQTILRGMLLTKLKFTAATALLAVGIASAGIVAIEAVRSSGPKKPAIPAPAAVPEPPNLVNDKPKAAAPDAMVEVRGRIVGPDGKPVPGAAVRTAFLGAASASAPETTSASDGRFLLPIPPARLSKRNDAFPWVVALAPGFGPGWIPSALKAGAAGEVTIRLVPDGPPIEGRIVDLQGQPVAGAQVKVERLRYARTEREPYVENGDLSAWIATVRDRGMFLNNWEGLGQLPTTIATTTTDRNGRFRLTGIGRERVAEILISAPTIATTQVYAMSRDGAEIRINDREAMTVNHLIVHTPRFEFATKPTQPIEGVVRDKDTGQPLAGLTLQAAIVEQRSLGPAPGVETMTDAQGRYRLTGLPKAPAYRIFVKPGAGKPYLNATLEATANSPGLEPIPFDIAMKRGILVRGRVTDKVTGRPVVGHVTAYTFRDNPHVGEFPGYDSSSPLFVPIKDDGQYEIVALPGHGLIACQTDGLRYRIGIGAEGIKEYDRVDMGFDTLPHHFSSLNCHVVAAVDLDPKTESATLDLQVDPGRSLSLTVVDPAGQPIDGTNASGIGDTFSSNEFPQDSSTIEVHALDPSKSRRVTITHARRKLAGSIYLKGDETGPLTVRLHPWGTITGRILDDEGNPRKTLDLNGLGFFSTGSVLPVRLDENGILPDARMGGDGRFRIEGLVPGLKYGASASEGIMFKGDVFLDVTVAPGEVKELGDLKVVRPKPNGQE
jgi:RNA polymerase sigma factor (sigma-70 family)